MTRFRSLDVFFQIITNERFFKIQIITLESLSVFESILMMNGIEYSRQFSSNIMISDEIILILKDSDVDIPRGGRYILFSNIRHKDFIQIAFNPTPEEKISVIGSTRIVRAYGYKNINELKKIVEEDEFNIYDHLGRGLDYFESVILLVMAHKHRFNDILRGVNEMDNGLGNGFLLQMKLNGLISRSLVMRNGGNYRLNVSEEMMRSIGKRIGFKIFT